MNAKFKYYFFNDNCAHRISKILELATGLNLSSSHGFWLLPMQVVRTLGKENEKENFDLIKQEKYHPSLKRTFFDKFNLLSKKEKSDFIGFFTLSNPEQIETAKTLNTKILILILDYLDIQVAKGTAKDKDEKILNHLQTQRSLILSQLWSYPTKSIKEYEEKGYQSNSLLTSQPASVVRAGFGRREGSSFIRTSYRVANNDFLNISNPGQEISKFIMGEVETEITEKSARLTKATLIDIVNFNTNPLPIRVTKEFSWGMKVDYSPRSDVCSNCSTLGVEPKGGIATRLNSQLMLYGLTGGRIHTKQGNRGIFTWVSEVGAFINITRNILLGLSANYYNDPILGHSEYILKGNVGFNMSRNYDFRVSVESDGEDMVSQINVGYFFD